MPGKGWGMHWRFEVEDRIYVAKVVGAIYDNVCLSF